MSMSSNKISGSATYHNTTVASGITGSSGSSSNQQHATTNKKKSSVWDEETTCEPYDDAIDEDVDGYDSFEGEYEEDLVHKFRQSRWGQAYEECYRRYRLKRHHEKKQQQQTSSSTTVAGEVQEDEDPYFFQNAFGLHHTMTMEIFQHFLAYCKRNKVFDYDKESNKVKFSHLLNRRCRYQYHVLPIELKALIVLNRCYGSLSSDVEYDNVSSIRGLHVKCADYCLHCWISSKSKASSINLRLLEWVEKVYQRIGKEKPPTPPSSPTTNATTSRFNPRKSKWAILAEKRRHEEDLALTRAELLTNQPIAMMSDAKIRDKYWLLSDWGKSFQDCQIEQRGATPNNHLFKARFKLNINITVFNETLKEVRVRKVFDVPLPTVDNGEMIVMPPEFDLSEQFTYQEIREFRLIPTIFKLMVPLFQWVRNGDPSDEEVATWSGMSVKFVTLAFALMSERWNMMALYDWVQKKGEEIEKQKREEKKAIAKAEREASKAAAIAKEQAERLANPIAYAEKLQKEKDARAKKRRKQYVHPDEPWLDLDSDEDAVFTPSGVKVLIPTTTNPDINALYQLMVQHDRTDLVRPAMLFFSHNGQMRGYKDRLLRTTVTDPVQIQVLKQDIQEGVESEKRYIEKISTMIKKQAMEKLNNK